MTRDELINLLNHKSIAFKATGSRVICDPPPMDTDEDYIVLMVHGMEQALDFAGFHQTQTPEQYEGMEDFIPYRLGIFNVIVTHDANFYRLFCEATDSAKALNLTEKADRIDHFQAALYGAHNEEVPL